MKISNEAFEPRNLFRNVYFWLAVGGTIFLLYVAFIAFTFLPRSTSEIAIEKNVNPANEVKEKVSETAQKTPKNIPRKGKGALARAKFDLIEKGGWVDSDDRKMTIVMKVFGLDAEKVDEIIRSGGIEIEIDGVKAAIINSEPFQKNGFLTRAEAVLSTEKFDTFVGGETQSVEIKTTLSLNGDSAADITRKRFEKQNKTEVEGVKINWK
ncbi:MAG TPA: hypothetical protein PKE69_15490 [Pyrinomonadaceae bacterium]|nr:hypothetical protein [Pyrinomonadaceae bacterium]